MEGNGGTKRLMHGEALSGEVVQSVDKGGGGGCGKAAKPEVAEGKASKLRVAFSWALPLGHIQKGDRGI